MLRGQLAHLDSNPGNNAEDNLAFLCFDHHDEYDGRTSTAKGLRESEVRHWRDELYREMEYRFRTIKRCGFELSIEQFLWLNISDKFKARFKLKNTGELAVRSPTLTIRLPSKVGGELPVASVPTFDLCRVYEKTLDLFEPNGRVAIKVLGGPNPVLMPGHSVEFEALVFRLADYPEDSDIELEYRVDAEESNSISGGLSRKVPTVGEMKLAAFAQ